MSVRIRAALVSAIVASALLGAACESPAPASPDPEPTATATPSAVAPTSAAATPTGSPVGAEGWKIAYVYDPVAEGVDAFATPPYQGAELAIDAAAADGSLETTLELVAIAFLPTPEGADAVTEAIAADPTYVAAIVSPGVVGQRAIVADLEVPIVSLSSRDDVEAGPGTWLRSVPTVEALGHDAGAWAAEIASDDGTLCISPAEADGSRFARAAVSAAEDAFAATRVVAATEIERAGCEVVVWTGDAEHAVSMLAGLGRPRPTVIGGPPLRAPSFVEDAGPAANGTLAVCGCADVTTSLTLDAQRFVQVYQSEYGLPPGPGAVEAWDAAGLLVAAIAATGGTDLAPWLAASGTVNGLGGAYAFGVDGELEDPAGHTHRSRVEGGRWITVEAADG